MMNSAIVILFLSFFVMSGRCYPKGTRFSVTREQINNAPIIGIVTEETLFSLDNIFPGKYKSYIAASYVKFIEGAGARVVPIWIGKERSYYEIIMSNINGILFPGGATKFNTTDGYAQAGKHIYGIAKEMNDNGNYFPLWGTCLGFELLTFLSANGTEHRERCDGNKQTVPLKFTNQSASSKMFSEAETRVLSILSTEAVTVNYHTYCLTVKKLKKLNLLNKWKILSLNKDNNGLEYISAIEHKRYPFYGVQFHPEKIMYEWVESRNLTHTKNAVIANSYFAEFFVDEARKNLQTFARKTDMEERLIYNFKPIYVGKNNYIFQQAYLFKW